MAAALEFACIVLWDTATTFCESASIDENISIMIDRIATETRSSISVIACGELVERRTTRAAGRRADALSVFRKIVPKTSMAITNS